MNRTKRDLLNLFFRRDPLRERIYPTRVATLCAAVVVLLGGALLLSGASGFREALGLSALRPAPASSVTATTAVSPTAEPALVRSTETVAPPTATISPTATHVAERCPITWKVQQAAGPNGYRFGWVDDGATPGRVLADYLAFVEWMDASPKGWDLSDLPSRTTPRALQTMLPVLPARANRREFVQVTPSSRGVVSMSFTLDGAGVTFFDLQRGPITQTVRSADGGAIKQSVMWDVSQRLVGVSMAYDANDCRWKVDELKY